MINIKPLNSFLKSILLILIMYISCFSCLYNHTEAFNKTGKIAYTKWHNFTDKFSEYFEHTPLLGNVTDKLHKFNEMLSNLFHYRNVSETDKIHQQLDEYHHKIQNYFKNYFPEERNVLKTLDRFANRLSDYLKKVNVTSDKGRIIIERFYEFTKKNFSDFQEEEFERDMTERFNKFMRRVENYLSNSNITSTLNKEYNISTRHKENEEPIYFVVYEHRHYLPRYSLCNSIQIDSCRLKCKKEDKILCGCFYVSNQDRGDTIDCLCADKPSQCLTHHTHLEIDENKQDLNKDL